jgi:hypothetical protein
MPSAAVAGQEVLVYQVSIAASQLFMLEAVVEEVPPPTPVVVVDPAAMAEVEKAAAVSATAHLPRLGEQILVVVVVVVPQQAGPALVSLAVLELLLFAMLIPFRPQLQLVPPRLILAMVLQNISSQRQAQYDGIFR